MAGQLIGYSGLMPISREQFRDWYENGVPEPRPWWRRLFGIEAKRVRLPTEYLNLFEQSAK